LKWLIPLVVLILFVFFLRGYWLSLPPVRQDQGRINFLFLGISGPEYQPPDLTDTMIFASYNLNNGKSFLLSFPRDIWSTTLKAKINTAYHYGSFPLTREVIKEMTDQPVHYILVLDFNAFKKAVDLLGGVTVEVQASFDDYLFPISGKENDECGGDKEFKCRYEGVHFEAGMEKMSGERALKYIRSRNAVGEEGTDLARSLRQQRFLAAFKNQLLNWRTLLNPQKSLGLIRIFASSVASDLKPEEYLSLVLSLFRFQAQGMKMEVLNGLDGGGLIYHPQVHSSGQWVLLPRGGSWQAVHQFVSQSLP